MSEYVNKTAMIVGGTSGIGLATARLFLQSGCNTVIAGIEDEAGGAALAANLQAAGNARCLFVKTDVRQEPDLIALVERTEAQFGGFDYALNNAGVEGPYCALQDITQDQFDAIMTINLRGIFFGMKHQIRHMLKSGRGAIVNTASSAGVVSIPRIAAYSASKHAVIGLTKAAALEQSRAGIRINAIAPGPVQTEFLKRMVGNDVPLQAIAESVPMGRISQPEEIAQAVVWLCSAAASYVTGHVLVIDGGLTVS